MIVPYLMFDHDEFGYRTKPLNPTGKYKYVTNESVTNKIFVQHKGWLFKSWVSENNIFFAEERRKETFNCNWEVDNE